MRVGLGLDQRLDQRRNRLSQQCRESIRSAHQHLGDTLNLRGSFSHGLGVTRRARHECVDLAAELLGGCDSRERRGVDHSVLVLNKKESVGLTHRRRREGAQRRSRTAASPEHRTNSKHDDKAVQTRPPWTGRLRSRSDILT